MSEAPRKLDDLLTDLEKAIARLADGTAPLEDLVAAHAKASTLLAEAQARLAELKTLIDQPSKC